VVFSDFMHPACNLFGRQSRKIAASPPRIHDPDPIVSTARVLAPNT
jgi:hypothetical protein